MSHTIQHRFFRLAYLLLILVATWGFLRFLLPTLLPFLLAFALAWAMEPLVALLIRRLHLRRGHAALLVTLAGLSLLGISLFFLGRRILFEVGLLLDRLPGLLTKLPDFTGGLTDWAYPYIVATPISIQSTLWEGLAQCATLGIELVSSASAGLLGISMEFIALLPLWGLFGFTTALATYFTSATRPSLLSGWVRYAPESWQDWLQSALPRLRTLFLGWLRAQGALVGICFLQLTIGFFLLGIDYPLLLAGGIALIDALPVLGTGTVLLPWALFYLLKGELTQGVSLLLLYGLIALVRGLLEPKLVGYQVGLPALVTLFAMYLGFQFLGVAGMIFAPLLAVFGKALFPQFS